MKLVYHSLLLLSLAAFRSEALLIPLQNKKCHGAQTGRGFLYSSLSVASTDVDGITVSKISEEEMNANLDLDFAPFDNNCFPGRDENDRFRCDPSVAFWRDFQNTNTKAQTAFSSGDTEHIDPNDNQYSVQDNVRDMGSIALRFASAQRASSSYFVRHLGRTVYFAMNAIIGDAAYKFSERNNNNDKAGMNGALPLGMSGEVGSRLVLETLLCYEQDYFDWIAKGFYREPWDMATPNHRQSNPFNVVTQTSRFVREAVGTLGRRSRGNKEDKLVKFFNNNKQSATATPGTKLYPDYYKTAFHYQGEGWMSTDSANVYETSTETLFLGRQDSMQRTSLPPVIELAKKFESRSRPMRVLEVACGTGRFMTFVRDNLPLDTEYTAVDLSPFYLEKATDNDSYWRRTRSSSTKTDIAPANLVQAQAEDLPFADNAFDAVVCVYLFHELPRHVRAKAAAEMARVVSPGGTVVFTDSIQKGDRPSLDTGLPNFQKMNEPFYIDYVNDDLGGHFESAGLIPETKIVRSTTKSLSFSKPELLP